MIRDKIKLIIAGIKMRQRTLSIKEWRNLQNRGLNSFEREALMPLLSDEALIEDIEYCLKNCSSRSRRPCVTYDDALVELYVPLLIERFKHAKHIVVPKCEEFEDRQIR